MPGPRQWQSPGGRGALLALGWDLCSLPELPFAVRHRHPPQLAEKPDVLQPPSPGQAEPSPLCLGPFLQHVRGDPVTGCAPHPPVQPSPWQGRCQLVKEWPEQGAVHPLSVSRGPSIVFYRYIFLTEKQSKQLPGHRRALGSSGPRPPGFGTALSSSDPGGREPSGSTGQSASPGPSRAQGDELGAMGGGRSFIHFL